MNKKIAAEQSLRAAVMANPDSQGAVRRRLGGGRRTPGAPLPPYNMERVMFEGGLGLYSDYFTMARTLLRWVGGEPASRTASGCPSTPTRASRRSSGRSGRQRRFIPGSKRRS